LHIYENIHIISQLYLKQGIYTSYSGLGFMRVHIGNDWQLWVVRLLAAVATALFSRPALVWIILVCLHVNV